MHPPRYDSQHEDAAMNCQNCERPTGGAAYCPSCIESYDLVAVKRPYCPEWLWRVFCFIHPVAPWLEPLFASRNPNTISAVLAAKGVSNEKD